MPRNLKFLKSKVTIVSEKDHQQIFQILRELQGSALELRIVRRKSMTLTLERSYTLDVKMDA